MEQWQMWSLRRTENPQELDRNQPAPLHGDDKFSWLERWIVDPEVAGSNPVRHPTMEACVSGLNSLPAKEVLPLRESKVRIFPFPQ